MTTRRTARRAALQLLYQSEIWGGGDVADEVVRGWRRENIPPEKTSRYVEDIVTGVVGRADELDEIIRKYARDWPLERMAVVDKNILRLALYEMHHRSDIPAAVSINEAVELAKRYATSETARFVNGILAAVKRDAQSSIVEPTDEPSDEGS